MKPLGRKIGLLRLSQRTLPFYLLLLLIFLASWICWMPPLRLCDLGFPVMTSIIFAASCLAGDGISFTLMLFGQVFWILRSRKTATEMSRIALDLSSDSAILQNQLAYLLAVQSNSLDDAEQLARSAFDKKESPIIADTLGWVLHKQGRFEEALPYLRQARRGMPRNACINFHLGLCLWKLQDNEGARKYLKRALWFRLLGGLSLGERRECSEALTDLGERSHLLAGLDLSLRVGLIGLVFATVFGCYTIYNILMFDEFMLWFNTHFDQQPDTCWATKLYNAHIAQIEIDEREGNYVEALRRWFMLRDRFVSEGSEWVVDMSVAELLTELGELEQAEQIYRSLFDDIETVTEQEVRDPLSMALANVLVRRADLSTEQERELMDSVSEEYLESPKTQLTSFEGRLSARRSYETLATYWRIWSLIHEKEQLWEEMLMAEQECYESLLNASTSLRRSDFYVDIQTLLMDARVNNYSVARRFVLGEWESEWHLRLGESLYRQAKALRELQRNERAQGTILLAEEHFDSFWEVQDTLDSPAMREVYDTSISLSRDASNVLYYQSCIEESRGNTEQSAAYAWKAATLLEEIRENLREKNLRANFALGRQDVYLQATKTALRNGQNEQAFWALEALKSRRLLDDFAVHWYREEVMEWAGEDERVESDDLAEVNRELHGYISDFYHFSNATQASQQIRTLMDKRRSLVRRTEDFTLNLDRGTFFQPVRSCEVDEVQSVLEEDELILEYFLAPNGGAWVFVITNEAFTPIKLVASSEQIRVESRILNIELSSEDKTGGNKWIAPAQYLYDALIGSIEPSMLSASHIIVIPHRDLHLVPFEVLIDNGGRLMLDKTTISYAPSSTVFLEIRKQWAGQSLAVPLSNQMIVAVYDPLNTLRGSIEEAEYLHHLFDAEVIPGNEATPQNVLQLIRGAQIVHFGTHSIIDNEEPLLSSLILAQDSQNSGLLDIRTILMEEGLENTLLVTLASCQSGIASDILPGDEVYNLGTCFVAVGARTSVSARWEIPDESTASLMKHFYDHLTDGPAEALRYGQLEVRSEYSHPFFWAGFMVLGDPWRSER